MGKLSTFLAQRKELEFDFEREIRAVCDLLKGVQTIGGREHVLQLTCGDGYVAEGPAKAIFINDLQATLRDVLVRYLHNLCFEGGKLGLNQALFEEILRAETSNENKPASSAPAPVAAEPADAEAPEAAARQLQDALSAAQAAA